MIKVNTHIFHDINEFEFKREIAITASLVKYQGKEYFDKLKALNSEYELPKNIFITNKELHTKLIKQL